MCECDTDNTASIILTHGGFSTEKSTENILEIEITDGGRPPLSNINVLHLKVCTCGRDRRHEYCKYYIKSAVSVSALIAILLCIITIVGKYNIHNNLYFLYHYHFTVAFRVMPLMCCSNIENRACGLGLTQSPSPATFRS